MNKEIKARWVEALRSGNYKQGRYNLRRGNFYCCLGVLCDVVKDEVNYDWLPLQDSIGTFYRFDRADEVLPDSVASYADLEISPKVTFDGKEEICITAINDDTDLTFDDIADLIEKQF